MGDPTSEEDKHGKLSVSFFWYINPLLALGLKRQLNTDDLPPVSSADQAKLGVKLLDEHWSYERSLTALEPSLYRSLYAAFCGPFMLNAIWKLALDLISFLQPYFLRAILKELNTTKEKFELGKSVFYIFTLFFVQLLQNIFLGRYHYGVSRSVVHVNSAIQTMIFRKTLSLSAEARQKNEGSSDYIIKTLMDRHASEVSSFLHVFHLLIWSAPLQILLSVIFLSNLLDLNSTLAGLLVLIIASLINNRLKLLLVGESHEEKKERELLSDLRKTAATDMVKGICRFKSFACEGLVDRRVENMDDSDIGLARLTMLRQRQVSQARKRTVVALLLSLFNEMTCSLVAVTVFGVYSYMGNVLTVDRAFPALLYFSILKNAVNPLLGQIRLLANAKRSLQELSFFCTPKHMPEIAHSLSNPKQRTRASFAKRGATLDLPPEVRITNGCFDWGANATGGRDKVLRGINVVFPAGKLTAVIGKAGCGKSSLLSALLGEMNVDYTSDVQLGCAVALSSQDPWMRNSSIRDNILFGCPMDSTRYADVLRMCCLQDDLNSLPDGDMTVFVKDSDLTKSQKQKIGVARAVYCGADVYMFDEPFAPLSSSESSHLFTSCFLEHLAGRTRILVTHQLDLLERVDHIVCMTDAGGILCSGSYAETSSKYPEVFSSILKKCRSVSDVAATSVVASATVSSLSSVHSSLANVYPPASKSSEQAVRPITSQLCRFYVDAIGKNRAVFVALLIALSHVTRALSYLWVAHWVRKVSDPSVESDSNFYVTIFGILIAASCVLLILRDSMLSFCESKAASSLHLRTCRGLLRAPLSFFATTPAESIISHLTKGQDTIDVTIPRNLNIIINGLAAVLCVLLVVSSIAWPFALIPAFIFYYYFKTAQLYLPADRELKRLQASVEPRISSLLSEAYSGARIIRAFGLVDNFYTEIENRVDALNRVVLPSKSVVRWLGFRMELCANCIVVCSCIAAVFVPVYHPGYWPGYAAFIGFALSEAFGVKDIVLHSVSNWSVLESSTGALHTAREYCEVESEAPRELANNDPASESIAE